MIRFEKQTAWSTVQRLLASESVDSRNKVGALRMILDEVDRVPRSIVRKVLSAGIPINTTMRGLSESAAGAVAALQVVSESNGPNAERHAARLLNGDAEEQSDLARLIGLDYVPTLRPLTAHDAGI
jgi:hypothetical protein